jgi:NitT/TauT family transport system permease protein
MSFKRKSITTGSSRFLPFVVMACVILLWQLGVSHGSSHILPGPLAVLKGVFELARKGLLLKYVVASLFRVTWGFLSAAIVGVPFGLFLGWRRRAGIAFNPIIQILRPISPLAWIPLAILWFGVGDLAGVFLIFLASFLPLTMSAMNAVRRIDVVPLNAGRNFGLSTVQLVFR